MPVRVQEHRDAGADHVCLQVLAEDVRTLPIDDCRRLAAVLKTHRQARLPLSIDDILLDDIAISDR